MSEQEDLEIIKNQFFNGLDQIESFLRQAEDKRHGIKMGIKLTEKRLIKEHVDHFRHSFSLMCEMCYQAKITGNMLESLLDEIEIE